MDGKSNYHRTSKVLQGCFSLKSRRVGHVAWSYVAVYDLNVYPEWLKSSDYKEKTLTRLK